MREKIQSLLYKYINIFRTKNFQALKNMNGPSLNFIRDARSSVFFDENLREISFDANNLSIDDVKDCFKTNGIVVITNFLGEDLCAALQNQVSDLLSNRKGGDYNETTNEKDFRKFRKARPDDILVNKRDNKDAGMIDIFNLQKRLSDTSSDSLNIVFNGKLFAELIGSKFEDQKVEFALNAYYNKSVLSTRGFHVDAFYPVIKAMIYLSDVNELDQGPYCYVKKSHKKNSVTEINKALSKHYVGEITETPFVSLTDVTPILGKAGTLIFSDQAGGHRGMPQSAEQERIMLVAKFI